MKVAHFISNIPKNENSEVYGKAIAVYNLCYHLAKLGHEIHIFSISNDFDNDFEEIGNLKIHRYKSSIGFNSEGFSFNLLNDPLSYDFDIIHVHSGISITVLAGYRYSVKKRIPLILTWHGDSSRGYGKYNGLVAGSAAVIYKKIFSRKLLNHAKIIISPTEYYIEVSKFINDYKKKIRIIPNGINLAEFDNFDSKDSYKRKMGISGKKVILFVGSLYPMKGPHILLQAIPKILEYNKDIIFIFVGGGDIKKYKKLSQELKIQNKVKFTGYLSGKSKINYYNASDIFVLPSIESFEIFGIVNLEAMASSTPIVASKIGGIPGIVKEGIHGLLVPPRDFKSLANAIIYLLKNPNLSRTMGLNGKKESKKYSWSKIARMTEKLYSELLTSKKSK